MDIEVGFPVAVNEAVALARNRWLTPSRLPAAERMISVTYVTDTAGDTDAAHRRGHFALGLWLDRHGCRFDGPGREIFHDRRDTGRRRRLEIQFPVTPRDADSPGSG
jgi:hypothetical protein